MFKLKSKLSVQWPVVINMPIDGGKTQAIECSASLKILPQDEFDSFAKKGDAQLLEKVVTGWDGIANEDGQPLTFSPENLKQLTAIPYVRQGLLKAYLDASSGIAAKN